MHQTHLGFINVTVTSRVSQTASYQGHDALRSPWTMGEC